jgi:hypothetical protein
MTQNEARESIYSAFFNIWGNAPVTEYTFDNEKFTPPSSAPWVRLSVRHMVFSQETLGKIGIRKFMRTGKVFVQVFTPQDIGTQEADILVDQVRAIFEGQILSGPIWFKNADVTENGVSNGWYMVTVSIDFQYEDTF